MSIVPPPPQPIFETSSSGNHKPAEVFRKDLISAMKLPDSHQLQSEEYYLIVDQWKQEWEKGVQVPVNLDDYPEPVVKTIPLRWQRAEFKLPSKRFLKYDTADEHGSSTLHQLASQVCRYDLDDTDTQWLKIVNREREDIGDFPIDELTMETLMEECEKQCHDNMTHVILTQEGLGIEYDEDVICDVCKSPDCEEGNEMVFCDSCDICVHQACYGIVKIPEGSWMCRTCALGIQPTCILCPKKKGAMKSTRSGAKWAHVSCALWIPEVSIGCVEKMEPITKISQIPSSRWALICNLCRERTGACIQCSVKTCKTAYHVSCGFQHNLEMKTYLDEAAEVKFKSFCMRHTKRRLQGEVDVTDSPMKSTPKKEKTQEEKANERALGIQQLEDEFFKQIRAKEVATALNMKDDVDAVDRVTEYWKLKRKSNFNRPLLPPKKEESGAMSQAEEDSLIARMRMFVHLRQDLERVRNLCYMVQKREKLSRQSNKLREQIFQKQSELLSDDNVPINNNDFEWVRTAMLRSESHIRTLVNSENEGSESTSSESTGQDDSSDSSHSEENASVASKESSRSKVSLRFNRQDSRSSHKDSSQSLTKDRQSTSHDVESASRDSLSPSKECDTFLVLRRRSASTSKSVDHISSIESSTRNANINERTDHRKATNNNQVEVKKEELATLNYECESGQKENKQDDVLSPSNLKRKVEPDPKVGTRSKRQRSNGSYDTLARRRIDTLFSKGNPVVPRVKLERTNIDAEMFKSRKNCDNKNKNRTPSGINERLRVLRRTEISPRQESMRDEAAKVRESLFPTQSSPKGSLSGYRIPKKNSNPSSIVNANVKENFEKPDLDNEAYTLKTRSATRKHDNEMSDVNTDNVATEKQFEYVDDEVSICRSSRDPSLAAESDDSGSNVSSVHSGPILRRSRNRKSESSNESNDILTLQPQLRMTRFRHSESSSSGSQDDTGSNSDSVDVENASNVYDSDSEGSSSSDGRRSGPVTRRRRKRSCTATSKRPFRSRVTDSVGRLWNTAAGF